EAAGDAAEAALRLPPLRHAAGGTVTCRGDFQIVAGGEGAVAGAGEDGDPHLGVGVEIVPDLAQLRVRVGVQRVEDFGAVQGHVGDVVLLLVEDVLVGHGRILSRPDFALPGRRRLDVYRRPACAVKRARLPGAMYHVRDVVAANPEGCDGLSLYDRGRGVAL